MALNSDTSAGSQGGQVVYYPGPHIVVTSHYIENAHGRYSIRDVHLVEQIHVFAHPARTVALICGAIELALAVPLAAAVGSVALLCTGFLTAFGLAVALMVDSRHNPRWMALRAVHQGQETTLFSSRDQQEFQRVRLAVVRAVQAARTPRP
jgi:hypothetical protein